MIRVSTITPFYKGEWFLKRFFQNVEEQTLFGEFEVVLVHNEPLESEVKLIEEFSSKYPGFIKHIMVNTNRIDFPSIRLGNWAKETIAQSMNRAISNASGDYVAIWNIDDIRTPDSLKTQATMLDNDKELFLVYGDFLKVREHGSVKGELCTYPEFDRNEFMRSCIGGFQMFRKSICNKIGLFDEQLRSGADFDLFVRIAANGRMKKAPEILGYYLDLGANSSASNNNLQPIERTVIELRYGIFDKIDNRYLNDSKKYRIDEIFFDGNWHKIDEFIPDYDEFVKDRQSLQKYRNINNRIARRERGRIILINSLRKCFKRPLEAFGIYEILVSFIKKIKI